MKKALLLSLATMLAVPTFAQDQVGDDCTKYIVNAGFDEDLTWNADGSTKTIVDKSFNFNGNRSQRWLAEDGTGYAWGGISSKKRKDGLTAWNGFFGVVKGWKGANGNNNSLAEWTYFGTLPYGLDPKAVAIGDDGTGFLEAPTSKPDEAQGDDNKGFLYLRAGWGGWATYTQNVHVPVGKYTLSYWVYNTNYEGSKGNNKVQNLTQVICRRDTVKDAEGFNAQKWTKHSIDITATDSLTITFGFKSDGGSVKNPYVCIDDIRLTKTDDVSRADILSSDLDVLLADMDEVASGLQDYQGVAQEVEDAKDKIYDAQESTDVATLEAAYDEAAAALARFKAVKGNISKVQALENKANKMRETEYPGVDALDAAVNAAEEAITNGTTADIEAQIAALDKAIKTYLASKEATEADPADFTYYVQNPWFIKDGLEPTVAADGTCTYPNATKEDGSANYTNGSGSNADFDATGWYKGSFTQGDQRLNFAQNRTCWNAWATNFAEISVNQDLVNLPNGYYKVSADLITQAAYVTDQHVFAKSPLEEAASEPLATGNWVEGTNDGTWTTLTSGKVLVSDGRLTIGAAGTGANGDQSGWFCATNFKLYYVGPCTAEEIAAATVKKEQAAAALVAGMHYAADKAAVQDSINAYNADKNIDVLNNGIKLGNTSEAKYTEVMAEGKTIPTVAAKIADETSYAPVHNIAAYAWEKTNSYLTSFEATYTAVDGKIAELKRYVDTYYTAAQKVDSVSNSLNSAIAKEALANTLAKQVEVLTLGDTIQNANTVNALIAQLNNAIAKAEAQEAYEKNPNATDYTGNIQNPDAAAEDGWNLNKGNGNTNTASGQYYDNRQTSHRYFDSWNGTKGALNYYADQKVVGLPNGIYEVSVYTRSSGAGAFVFSANGENKADTTWNEIPLNYFNVTHNDFGIGGQTAADGSDSIIVASDKFGPLWEEATRGYNTDPTNNELGAIHLANNGNGFGWQKQTWTTEVVNHELTIGMTSDSLRTPKAFEGTWFSVVDWGLKLLQAGDNNGWNGPITGVTEIKTNNALKADAIYTINGQRVAKMAKPGLYIVVENGKAKKVMMK